MLKSDLLIERTDSLYLFLYEYNEQYPNSFCTDEILINKLNTKLNLSYVSSDNFCEIKEFIDTVNDPDKVELVENVRIDDLINSINSKINYIGYTPTEVMLKLGTDKAALREHAVKEFAQKTAPIPQTVKELKKTADV